MKSFIASLAFVATAQATEADPAMFVIAKSYGSEIRYRILNSAGGEVCRGGPFSSNSDNVVTDCQMTAGDYSV